MKHYIGVDIGGTKCAVSLGLESGAADEMRILGKNRFDTPKNKPMETLSRLAEQIDGLMPEEKVKGIGISCGGPLDSAAGIILSPPNLPGWDHVEISRFFQERYHVPVYLHNDANACAVAEWKYGAGRGLRNLVFLTFGTGMGAGLILDGRLYPGTNDMAGEVGHWRMSASGPEGYGKAGSFEGFCSGAGIARAACERATREEAARLAEAAGGMDKISAKTVAGLADGGDEFCKSIYAECGRMLGRGLALIIDLLNPQAIILGSIFTRSAHLLWKYAQEEMDSETVARSAGVCRVLPAQLGESIGDIAALTVATGKF